jgi:predicted DNA-binding helix-hairpin-helix protein
MVLIRKSPDTDEKLDILSRDARYDLACACATGKDEHRRRSADGRWIYPVTLADGRTTYLFKTLLSNECVNNCRYCPLRAGAGVVRCHVEPETMARRFLSYYQARRVSGLFLSSAVTHRPDTTMEHINRVALYARRAHFKGYIHLKIIPGASDDAIRQSLALASAVSLNIEAPTENRFKHLSTTKDYARDVMKPLELISRLTAKGSPYRGVKQTTQFVVGASNETDREIIRCFVRLYKGLGLSRVYFSAYQRGAGAPELPGEHSALSSRDLLTREHRLYQADWLVRKYGFGADEIPCEPGGNLSLSVDPKEMWARSHPEFFPVNLNRDAPSRLLRVPGLGQVMVERIMGLRQQGVRLRSLGELGRRTRLFKKAEPYVTF